MSSSAEDSRVAAQKRAEELVARIRSEKEAKVVVAPASSPGATSPETPFRSNEVATATPERTPQIPTPVRPAPPLIETRTSTSVVTESASTVVIRNKPSLQLDTVDSAASTALVSPSRKDRDATPPVSPSSTHRTGPPASPGNPPSRSSSPLRAAQAANAIDMANAAIESARRASLGGIGGGAEDGSTSNSIGSAVYIPSPSIPTSPVTSPVSMTVGQSGSGYVSGIGMMGSASPATSNLDLRSNDSAFHVMANMITSRLMPKLADGETSYSVDANDRAFFDRMLPHTVRWSFVDALRYRRERLSGDLDERPMGGESTTDELARKCCWLGLDRPEGENVLLQPHLSTMQVGQPDYARAIMERVSASTSASFSNAQDEIAAVLSTASQEQTTSIQEHEARLREQQAQIEMERLEAQQQAREQQAELEKEHLEAQQQVYKEQVELQKQQIESQKEHINLLLDTSKHSTAAVSAVEQGVDCTTASNVNVGPLDESFDDRARTQITNELNEASAMIISAKSSEAANFWRAHVSDLENRLQELGGSVPPMEQVAPMRQLQTDGRPDDAVSNISTGNQQVPVEPRVRTSPSVDTSAAPRAPSVAPSAAPAPPPHSAPTPAPSLAPVVPPTYQPMVYEGLPMVDVIAPADLPAGYTFEAQMGSKRFLATVPHGGVRRGDRFSCPMKSLDRVEIQAPTGRWRDGIFDVLQFGAFHPLVLNAIFLPLIAVGQIMSRNHLTWLGDHGTRFQSMSVFTNMLCAVVFWGLMNLLFLFVIGVTLNRGNLPSYLDYVALALVNVFMVLFTIYAVARTRGELRARYQIPLLIPCGGKTEDYTCATFCMPCTITQMGRHTADFDTYRAVCCSGTGLPKNVDVVPEPLSAQGTHILDDSHFV